MAATPVKVHLFGSRAKTFPISFIQLFNLFISLLLLLNHLMAPVCLQVLLVEPPCPCAAGARAQHPNIPWVVPSTWSPPHPWHSCLITLSHFNLFQPFLCFPRGPFPGILLPSSLVEWPARVSLTSRANFAVPPILLSSDVPKCGVQRSQRGFEEQSLGLILTAATERRQELAPSAAPGAAAASSILQSRVLVAGQGSLRAAAASGLRLCALQAATRFNEELARLQDWEQGGFIPSNPSWVLWRQAATCPESRSVAPAYVGFFFPPAAGAG